MQDIVDITHMLASSVVLADPSDLPALAQMHEHLKRIGELAEKSTDGDASQRSQILQVACAGEKLIERIILREVQDTQQTLQQVGDKVQELQRILDGASAPTSPQALQATTQSSPVLDNSTETPVEATLPAETAPVTPAENTDETLNPDDVPMVLEFIGEALEHIASAEAAVLKIEENPGELEAVNAVFRGFHTIKGVAGFLNLKRIGSLAHAAENLLDHARHGSLRLEGTNVDVVLESIDMMKRLIDALDVAAKAGTSPATEPGLQDLIERLNAAANATLGIASAVEPAIAPTEPPAAAPATTPASASLPEPAANSPVAKEPPRPENAKAPTGSTSAGSNSSDATVKVATDRLDSLINMVGELVIAQSMVSQDMLATARGNQRIERNVSHLSKITRELQDLSMSMRMVPIQGVFQKMARLVRDLARKAGKEIDFVVIGGETELDRNVVEAISDPLVHMVRNSLDHGIETPEQRLAAGKPRQGKLELRARHQAGNIVIEITDDGRGLNKQKILAKAIANGIVREGQELGEQEIFKLIFAAGLSTADKVTDISGRGVGMDVVKRNVEALRGRIDIVSAEGKGSTFTIRLPLTLAVIDGQILRVGDHRYIVPITSIEQSIQPRAEQLSTVQERGEMCMVRGALLPLFRLYRMFGVNPQSEDPTKALVVIVQDDTRRCCLLVDELLGQQQVVIKSLGDMLGSVPGISGGAILGDGNVSLILDVPGLISMATGD